MKQVHVDDLIGNEILAQPVVSDAEVILIQSGTVLKQEYIEKIKELNMDFVYIREAGDQWDERQRDEGSSNSQSVEKENHIYKIEETKKDTEKIVQKVFERHIYKHNQELKAVGEAANRILDTVLEEPEVVNSITEIRNISTDMYTHCINVCTLSTIMALRLRMSEKQVHNIAVGAMLHDIGLRYIQVSYINRDDDDMSEKEKLEYKKHTIYGYSSIQDEDWLSDTSKEIILLHHERMDGSGFPFSQKGDKIRTEVKLVSICDEFDSLISGIGNKKLKIYEAIEYMKVHAGDIFDSNIAAKLLESIAVYPVGMKVITSDGERGVVLRQNRDVTDRPVLRMTHYADGREYEKHVEKNLMKYLTVFIVDTE